MAERSLLSGQIAIPEGAYALLQRPDVEEALKYITQNLDAINDAIGAASGTMPTARVAADGTLISGIGMSSPARSGLGEYTVNLDTVATSTNDVHPVATPMEVSGAGGGGINAYKAFGADVASSATDNSDSLDFFYSALHEECFALGSAADNIFIHDINDWTATPTQEDPGDDLIRPNNTSGCLDKDGDIVYLSGDVTGPVPVRAYKRSTDTHTDFGSSTDTIVIGARDGYIVCLEPSNVVAYQPNFGTPALGSAVQSWGNVIGSSIGTILAWDVDGYGWAVYGTAMFAFNPESSTYRQHNFPYEISQADGVNYQVSDYNSRAVYDANRRALYVCLLRNAGELHPGIWRYMNWDNSLGKEGQWVRLTTESDLAVGFEALAYDSGLDVLYGLSQGGAVLRRYRAHDGYHIDDVSVDDLTSPDNPEVDYDADTSRTMFAPANSGSVYIGCTKGGQHYIVRVDYNGAEIGAGGGSGGGEVDSVLVAHTVVNSTSQVGVKIYRVSQHGYVRADAQFSVHVGYKKG